MLGMAAVQSGQAGQDVNSPSGQGRTGHQLARTGSENKRKFLIILYKCLVVGLLEGPKNFTET